MKQNLYFKFLRGFGGRIFILSILGVLASACGVSLAMVSKWVVDVATGQQTGSLIYAGLVLAVGMLLQLLLNIFITVLHVHTSATMMFKIQADLFKKLLCKQKLETDRFHSGELVNRLGGDTAIVSDGITEILPSVLAVGSRIVFSFCALLFLDKVVAILCLIAGILMVGVAQVYRKKTSAIFKESRDCDGKLMAFLQETSRNLTVIKAFSVQPVMERLLKKTQKSSFDLTIKKNNLSIGANVCFFIAMSLGYYMALGWGAWRIFTRAITFGSFTAILGLMGDITDPFKQLASLFPQYMSVITSAERLQEIENLEGDLIFETEAKAEVDYNNLSAIKVDNISFSYGGAKVLRKIDLSFKKGEISAVTGVSGVGKSTLLNLIIGILKPASGKVLAEFSDGKMFETGALRGLMAYVPQEFMLLSGTVLENITLFDENPDYDRVWKAIEIARLTDEVNSLENGLDTFLGEGGGRLSGGQRQRMSIARALYSNAEVLLMDESTSALSIDTEEKILTNLKESGKTVIFVTHRISAVNLCDCSYNIENGQIK